MPAIILIRRIARPDRIAEFEANYRAERPTHHGFIAEFLTRLDASSELPEPLRSFQIGHPQGVTYINVAFWKSANDFNEAFSPKTFFDSEIEIADRVRAVLEVQDAVGNVLFEELKASLDRAT